MTFTTEYADMTQNDYMQRMLAYIEAGDAEALYQLSDVNRLRAILEAHYARTLAALDRSARFSAENEADAEACDTAALCLSILFAH